MGNVGRRNRFISVLGVLVAGLVVVALFSSAAEAKMTLKDKVGDNELKLQIYGFAQFEARGGDGWQIKTKRTYNPDANGLDFTAQRVRVGFNYFHGPIAGKLFLDFNQSYTIIEGGLPKIIKDAFVAYRWNNAAFLRLGMIKTPLGMDFTMPGWNLDIIERNGLEKGLVLERDFGVMLSGRLIGQERFAGKKQMKTNGLEMGNERTGYGFGYNIGVFNPAGRSGAVTWSADEKETVVDGHCSVDTDVSCTSDSQCPSDPAQVCVVVDTEVTQTGGTVRGGALSYVGRIHFDWGRPLHFEAAYGKSAEAGGFIDDPTTSEIEKSEDYTVMDAGVSSRLDFGLDLKLEYINGSNIRGTKDWDQQTFVFTAGYLFVPMVEFVVKTYQSKSDRPVKGEIVDTKLGNTYIGFNFFLARVSEKARDLQRHKVVLNYVAVTGDDKDAEVPWMGLGGYKDKTYGLQWQYRV